MKITVVNSKLIEDLVVDERHVGLKADGGDRLPTVLLMCKRLYLQLTATRNRT